MHCLATNVCVWVRTLVRESLKEIKHHHAIETGNPYEELKIEHGNVGVLHHVAEAIAAVAGGIGVNNDDKHTDIANSSVVNHLGESSYQNLMLRLIC